MLVTPQDPRSFVAISDVIKWTKPRTPTPSPVRNDLGASRHSTVADVMEPASSIISSSPSSHSENHPMPPSPSPPALSSPMRSEWRRPGLPVVHLRTDRAIPATPVEEPIVVAAAGSSAIARSPHPASFSKHPVIEVMNLSSLLTTMLQLSDLVLKVSISSKLTGRDGMRQGMRAISRQSLVSFRVKKRIRMSRESVNGLSGLVTRLCREPDGHMLKGEN